MSTNDFTNALLKKLNGTETGAQKNKEGTVIDKNYVHTDNNFTDAEKNKIAELQQENTELSNNMPWNTISGKSLHITDSAKYSKNRLEVSGDLEQEKRSGKNKFIPLPTGNNGGITITRNEDGTYNLSGTATINVSHIAFVDLDKSGIKNNAAYILSSTKNIPTGVDVRVEMFNGTSWLKVLVNSTTMLTATANTTNVTKIRFGIFVTSGTTVNIQNLGVQLEEGTVATDYEQYGAMPSTEFPSMPVVCTGVQKIRQFGKNWLNIKKGTVTAHGLTVTIDNQNVIHINGTVNTSAYPWLYISKDTLKIMQGTPSESTTVFTDKNLVDGDFTISFKYNGKYYDGAKHIYNNTKYVGAVNPYNYDNVRSFNSGMNGITIYLGEKGQVFTNATIEIMINKGIVKEQYEPYWEQIHTLNLNTTELCAIKENGNIVAKDRHVYRNGKWQWEKIIKKRVLNGTENWTDDTVSTVKHFRGKLDNLTYSKTNNAYCDKFICRTSEAHGEWEYIYIIGKACFINIDNTKLTEVSLNGFKTWLSSNNVTVYYVLATPEYIDCTAEQSAVLDKLHSNFTLQKGVNNVIVESENGVTVDMELTYMQDLQTKLNSLEAMCVSNASQEV